MDTNNKDQLIKNVSEYINVIKKLSDQKVTVNAFAEKTRLFYRGQPNKEWPLLPSIARPIKLLLKEADMVQAAKLKRPDEFSEIQYPFNLLAKLQHYGMPTRLLDITENPLVALYFACMFSENENSEPMDGSVFFFRVEPQKMHTCYSLVVNIIASMSDLQINNYCSIGEFIERIISKKFLRTKGDDRDISIVKKLVEESLANYYFVIPEEITERERNQKSAFIIFPNVLDNGFIEENMKDIKSEIMDKMPIHLTIPNEHKEKILDELCYLGISEATLFPELEHFCSEVKTEAKKCITGL